MLKYRLHPVSLSVARVIFASSSLLPGPSLISLAVVDLGRGVRWTQSPSHPQQGSHFFGLTKFHDISMIFPGFLVNFQVFFKLFLKYDFQVVMNINMQTY